MGFWSPVDNHGKSWQKSHKKSQITRFYRGFCSVTYALQRGHCGYLAVAANRIKPILDEIDNLTDLAQASFKAIMNRSNVVFVMTTNHLEKLDMGIQNRSVLIDMNLPPPQQWRPILKRVFTDAGLAPPPDQVLDQTVVAGRGSARSIFSDVVLSANHRIRQGEAANDGQKG
jgi:hypothetical protein